MARRGSYGTDGTDGTNAAPADSTVVVGRQGIHGADGLIGYELLFRRADTAPHDRARPDGDAMTSAVVFGALNIGLRALVGEHSIFCNVDRGVLTGGVPLLLPPERTVLEVVETVEVDDEILAGCQRLSDAGYRLALDDFRWGLGHEKLLPLASFVKVDLLVSDVDEQEMLAQRCAQYGVRLVGEKIENRDDLPRLRELGYDLFQGYALDRPEIVTGRTLTPESGTRLHAAVDLLGNDEAGFDEFEAVLRRDPALAHQVMLLASLGRLGETRRRLNSIRDALVLAGTRQIRNWLALLLARPTTGTAPDNDAFLTTLVRARACELLAPSRGIDPGLAFTAGLLSSLDALLQVPQREIVSVLAIGEELQDAAFGGIGPVAGLVHDVTQCQRDLIDSMTRVGEPASPVAAAVARAFRWGTEAVAVLD